MTEADRNPAAARRTGSAEGHPHQCRAHARSGQRCKRFAILGATVCPMHGGRAPQVKAAAARRRVRENAGRLGLDDSKPIDDPVGALMELGGEATALVRALKSHVADLERVGTVAGGRWGDQIDPTIAAYLSAIREAERVLSSLARLNLSERLVRLDEQRAELVVRVIEAVLSQHGLDTTAIDVRASVARQLELVAR